MQILSNRDMRPHVVCHMLASVDGREGMVSLFDGIADKSRPATKLHPKSVQQMGETIWARYKFKS